MKIIHLINSLGNGGAEKNLIRLTLNDIENEHIIITLKKNNFYQKLLRASNIKFYNFNISLNKNFLKDIQRIFYLIKKIKPQILMCWMYHSCFFGSIIKLFQKDFKLVWNIRHSNFILGSSKIKTIFLARLIMPFLHNIPNLIIFNSQHSYNIHKKYFFLNSKKIVIRNGFNLPNVFKKKSKIPKTFKIGFVGRYSPQKNYIFFFKFLQKLREMNFNFNAYLVGAKVNKNNLALIKLINKFNLNKNIIFLKQKKNIDQYYQKFNILISTSFYGESFPNVIAESLMNRTICMAPDIGENFYIINDKKFIYAKNNLDDLLKKFLIIFHKKKNKKFKLYEDKLFKKAQQKLDIKIMLKKYKYFLNLL